MGEERIARLAACSLSVHIKLKQCRVTTVKNAQMIKQAKGSQRLTIMLIIWTDVLIWKTAFVASESRQRFIQFTRTVFSALVCMYFYIIFYMYTFILCFVVFSCYWKINFIWYDMIWFDLMCKEQSTPANWTFATVIWVHEQQRQYLANRCRN